jgi:hypothetical protein
VTRPTTARVLASVGTATGSYVHLVLYRRSYHAIAHIGILFALDVVIGAGIAIALLTRRERMVLVAALALDIGALGGFVLSRTVGLLGFKESGLQPSPEAAAALGAEGATLAVLAWALLPARARRTAETSSTPQLPAPRT